MKHTRTIAALFVLAVSLFASTAYAQTFNIRAGDLLRVEVLEDSSINREVLVAPDGRISMPLAGNGSHGKQFCDPSDCFGVAHPIA